VASKRWSPILVRYRDFFPKIDVIVVQVKTQVEAFILFEPPEAVIERIDSLLLRLARSMLIM
jgi:hypothetical protein